MKLTDREIKKHLNAALKSLRKVKRQYEDGGEFQDRVDCALEDIEGAKQDAEQGVRSEE